LMIINAQLFHLLDKRDRDSKKQKVGG